LPDNILMKKSKPEFPIVVKEKPEVVNKNYPLQTIDHRDFEKLIYCLFETEMQVGRYKGLYDDIWLMEGVREKGKDCSLYSGGNLAGVVQCKHSETLARVGKVTVAKDIIKFLLHVINDKEEIVQPFHYYFTVSSAFEGHARKLLENFNVNILKEADLQKWTLSVIKENKALNELDYETIKDPLHLHLQQISVHHLDHTDITGFLNEPYNVGVIDTFFTVTMVVRETPVLSQLSQIEESLIRLTNEKQLFVEQVKSQFNYSSVFLSNHPGEFFNLPDSHIDRRETEELYQWIVNPLSGRKVDDNIVLISGGAGAGKSVIMKDLQNRLRRENIPVLGIKADRFAVNSIKELEERLNLEGGIIQQLQILSSQYETVVVLVDQIDALSQTLSSQREPIDAYRLLIETIKHLANVRIVISIRTFDLNYDPDLQVYKNQKVISVSLLSDDEVATVLKKLRVDPATISTPLISILRTPHHLNVFCKIFRPGFVPASIKTTQDLYGELWRQTLSGASRMGTASSASVKTFLQILAEAMNERQQISLLASMFSDEYNKVADYLTSEGILIKDVDGIQFFHQTFYDFVFAKTFIETNQSVERFVLQKDNSIHIRSSLKMIMGFLREDDNLQFVQIMERMLASPKYSFHIKLLLYNLLGFIERPSPDELQMLQKVILANNGRRQLYLESVYSEQQLLFLMEQKTLHGLLFSRPSWPQRFFEHPLASKFKANQWAVNKLSYKPYTVEKAEKEQLCFSVLAKHLPLSRNAVLQFLTEVPEFEGKGAFVFRLLYFVKVWDDERAFYLFERYKAEGFRDTFQFFHILQDVVPVRPDWVISLYKPMLLSEINGSDSLKKVSHDRYQEGQLFEKLFEQNPIGAFEFAWEVLDHLITRSAQPHHIQPDVLVDPHFLMFTYERGDRERGTFNQLYTFLIETLASFLSEGNPVFADYYSRIFFSNKMTFYRLLVYAFDNQTENLNQSAAYVFSFFEEAAQKGLLALDEKLEYFLRRVLKKYFDFFTREQKDVVINTILVIKDPYELQKHNYRDKPDFFRNEGLTVYKYLVALPRELLLADSRTKKRFGELERKYSKVKESEPFRVRSYSVGAPLEQNAYNKMNFEQWLNSFKHYDTDDREHRTDPSKGGLTQHYRAFQEAVKNRPNHFLPFIERLLTEDVNAAYVVAGLEGLKEGKLAPDSFLPLYKQAISKNFERFETLQLIWMLTPLIESQTVDEEIVDFLIDQALHNPDPVEDRGQAMQDALNTVRGAAVDKLALIYFNSSWEGKIFEALEQVAVDAQVSVRVSLVLRLAYLMNLNQERAFSLFVKLTESYNPDIYKASIHSVQYLKNYSFERLHPYFLNFIRHPDGAEQIASVLAIAYMEGKPGSDKLLKSAFKVNDELRKNIIHIGWKYVIDKEGKIDKKAAEMFLMGRRLSSEAITQEYSRAFLQWKPKHFATLFPVIYKYSRSQAGKRDLHYFYEYLLKCVKAEPEKCLKLISNLRTHIEPEPGKRMGGEEPIQIVIGIYNSVSKRPNKKKEARKALQLFDYLLHNPTYRRNASKVTEEVEK
jgi:hypothetical protein